jgi:hypothetical protein
MRPIARIETVRIFEGADRSSSGLGSNQTLLHPDGPKSSMEHLQWLYRYRDMMKTPWMKESVIPNTGGYGQHWNSATAVAAELLGRAAAASRLPCHSLVTVRGLFICRCP